ncbi:MAG: hypothetical protein P0119_22280 [Nitrospira sp.]|nr:hypothetical protein [Nitrospira sp.]
MLPIVAAKYDTTVSKYIHCINGIMAIAEVIGHETRVVGYIEAACTGHQWNEPHGISRVVPPLDEGTRIVYPASVSDIRQSNTSPRSLPVQQCRYERSKSVYALDASIFFPVESVYGNRQAKPLKRHYGVEEIWAQRTAIGYGGDISDCVRRRVELSRDLEKIAIQ